jgi:hypothetical protein
MVESKRWLERLWRGLTLLAAAAAGLSGAAADDSVITYHGAADRSGHYIAPKLTWTQAATVRLDAGFHATVDGAIYAQPLYWVPPAGGGAARIIVATEKNFVYALDADTGAQIWRTSLGARVPLAALPCGNINPPGGHRHADDRSGHWNRLFGSVRPDVRQRTAPQGVRTFARDGQPGVGLAGRRQGRT